MAETKTSCYRDDRQLNKLLYFDACLAAVNLVTSVQSTVYITVQFTCSLHYYTLVVVVAQ